MHTAGEESHPQPYPALDHLCYSVDWLARCIHCCDSGIKIMEVTNCSLMGYEACCTGGIFVTDTINLIKIS